MKSYSQIQEEPQVALKNYFNLISYRKELVKEQQIKKQAAEESYKD